MYFLLKLYKQPYNPLLPIVCMDEKSKQLLADTRHPIEARPGKSEKYDYEYKRKGTCNVFVAVEPKGEEPVYKSNRYEDEERVCLFCGRISGEAFCES